MSEHLLAAMVAYSSFSFMLLCFLFQSFIISDAIVPPNETFTYVNQGPFVNFDPFEPVISEYDSSYRRLPLFNTPFGLCFYNTTRNNAYTLALRMGVPRDNSVIRWVWEANRGKPVRENATLSLGSDGNLILAEANGQIVWQTNTANKGVVGLALLSNGNMVLRDSKGNFVWQSFDYPTDTLLIGQTLRVNGGPYKLVSRQSATNNVDGDYSFVLEPKRVALYYKNNMRYWSSTFPAVNIKNVVLTNATFKIAEGEYEGSSFHEIECGLVNAPTLFQGSGYLPLGTVLYNSSLSYFRLGIDGNLRVYVYNVNVRRNALFQSFTLFVSPMSENSRNRINEDECQLPNRCGKFGLCEDGQCVGCPTPKGVFGWSKDCDTKSTGCNASGFTYYQLKGVDHFTVKYTPGTGPVKRSDCESKCTKDCKCMGYFYHTDSSRCWVANELKTLTRVGNSTHSAYIKTTPIS